MIFVIYLTTATEHGAYVMTPVATLPMRSKLDAGIDSKTRARNWVRGMQIVFRDCVTV